MPNQIQDLNQNSEQNKKKPFSLITVKTLLAILLSLGTGIIIGLVIVSGWNFIIDIDKRKCEKSGGRWDKMIPNCPGCKTKYFCDCVIDYETSRDGKNSKYSSKFRLKQDNFCLSCQQDSDCSENKCETSGNKCKMETAYCEEGICYAEYNTYGSYDGDEIYNCVDNECQILNDNNDTSDWQIYRNEEFGFEVEYPSNFKIEEIKNQEKDNRIIISSQLFLLTIDNNPNNFDLKTWYNKEHSGGMGVSFENAVKKEEVNIGGNSTIVLIRDAEGSYTEDILIADKKSDVIAYFSSGSFASWIDYIDSWEDLYNENEQKRDMAIKEIRNLSDYNTFNQILSTFKFTQENENTAKCISINCAIKKCIDNKGIECISENEGDYTPIIKSKAKELQLKYPDLNCGFSCNKMHGNDCSFFCIKK